jgi:peroxin-3
VQSICDSTTLPLAMHQLCEKIMSELDILKLTDKLRQGKVESSALTPKEKYDTWEAIKIKSTVVLIFLLQWLSGFSTCLIINMHF